MLRIQPSHTPLIGHVTVVVEFPVGIDETPVEIHTGDVCSDLWFKKVVAYNLGSVNLHETGVYEFVDDSRETGD